MFLFSHKSKYVNPYTRPGYKSPFMSKDMVERDMKKRRYEVLAHFTKARTGDKRPIRDIAAELYQAEEKMKGRL